ncbi:sialidase family protein [Solwaraspora sp. WMMD406]|uniref:sialidase family protein n=1 Tax=Solwaraspora sp. WMMD406 TaxID=3016095 RepID=UPI002415C26E|nr:sialidase family protein [Solwaraspora sp. WMMD406]MDG4763996.1 sialidase family protein [Solwaraspora sp. WMMD406]
MKIKTGWIKAVAGGGGCKVVSPWVIPLMLVPFDETPRDDTRLYWSVYTTETGQWSDREQITDDADSDYTPALAAHQGRLYLAYTPASKHYLSWMVYDPTDGWSEERLLANGRNAGPAMVSFNGDLYCFWRNFDPDTEDLVNHIMVCKLGSDGLGWSTPRSTGKTSYDGPSVAVFDGELVLAWTSKDKDYSVMVSTSPDGDTWSTSQRLSMTTSSTPVLAVHKDKLHLVHNGSYQYKDELKLYHAWRNPGQDWTDDYEISQTSTGQPALASYDGHLHMTHLGGSKGDDQVLFHSWYDEENDQWVPGQRAGNDTSKQPPALVNYVAPNADQTTSPDAASEQLYMANRGTKGKA